MRLSGCCNRVFSFAAGRTASVSRSTKETEVSIQINLDGTGQCNAASGIPFLDHMLDVCPFTPLLSDGDPLLWSALQDWCNAA